MLRFSAAVFRRTPETITLHQTTLNFNLGSYHFYQKGGASVCGGPDFVGVVKGGDQFFFSGPKGGSEFFEGQIGGTNFLFLSQVGGTRIFSQSHRVDQNSSL